VKQLTPAEAKKITLQNVLGGSDDWSPAVPAAHSSSAATELNIQYGEANGEKLLLDAHVPPGDGKHPVVLIVHGGGWSSGDKETDIVPVFAPFATNFTWFTINYRLAPTNRWPACYEDVQTAIRWVKAHATEYKGDPERIALMGYSAGGHLVTLAGTDSNAATRVQAIVGFAPPTEIAREAQRRGDLDHWVSMKYLLGRDSLDAATLKLMDDISPASRIQAGLPPFLLVQGSADKTVLAEQTQDFQAKLKAAGVNCDWITITNGQHRIADWSKFHPGWQDEVVAWLNEKLSAKP
jgi:acetyl esterase/lipase